VRRGALVGCGFIAPRHLAAWREIDAVTIEAVCDKDPVRARALADRFGIGRVFTSFEALLEKCELDFVDLASGPETHLGFVSQAVQAGLDVLLQKPFADSPDAANQIVELAAKSGRTVAVNEMWKWMPAYRQVKSMLGEHALGDIRNVRFSKLCNLALSAEDGGIPPFLRPQRQVRFRTMPRLILFEYGVHLLDVLRSWFGECAVITAITSRMSPYVVGEDAAFVELGFDGFVGTLELDWCVPGPDMVDPLHHERVVISGTRGLLIVEGARKLTYQRIGGGAETRLFDDDPRAGGFLASQADFAAAIAQGGQPASPVSDNVNTLRSLWACYSIADAHGAERGSLSMRPT
jgi:predicted dehydrogenase